MFELLLLNMLSIGIVGLPNVGKSTLFKALTNNPIDIQNYPFTTIEPNVGVVSVPDKRLEALTLLSNSKKTIPTTITFIDIAGLVKGAAQGEGLGNKFLAHIREVDAICQVVRVFNDENITHINNKVDPKNDIEVINTELILADLETIENRIEKTRKQAKLDKKASTELIILEKFKKQLESDNIISNLELSESEKQLAKELNLLSSKKFIYSFNASEKQIAENWQPDQKLLFLMNHASYAVMSNKLELLLSESTEDLKKEYLTELNLKESGLDRLIKIGYETLELITFLTTGEDETRAWTAKKGDPIPIAARAIHTDFEKLFIRAEIINWKTLIAASEGGEPRPNGREADAWSQARIKGVIKTVGRDYVVQEGDVVEIKI